MNGLFEQALTYNKPPEKLLFDICKTPDDMKLVTWDFLATFGIIVAGYMSSSLLLTVEYFYKLISRGKKVTVPLFSTCH